MEITGNFIRHYDIVEGEKNGKEWRKTNFTIMTTDGNSCLADGHSRIVGFTVFGSDKVAMVQMLNSGDTVSVRFYPESREFGGKIYTELNVVRILVLKPLKA